MFSIVLIFYALADLCGPNKVSASLDSGAFLGFSLDLACFFSILPLFLCIGPPSTLTSPVI